MKLEDMTNYDEVRSCHLPQASTIAALVCCCRGLYRLQSHLARADPGILALSNEDSAMTFPIISVGAITLFLPSAAKYDASRPLSLQQHN